MKVHACYLSGKCVFRTDMTMQSIALFKFITEHDVPAVPATRILSIVRNSPNGRVLFNELQKAFGNKNASEYMRVLREWKNAQ